MWERPEAGRCGPEETCAWRRALARRSLIHALMHSFTAVSWGRLFTDRRADRLGEVVSRAFDDSYFL